MLHITFSCLCLFLSLHLCMHLCPSASLALAHDTYPNLCHLRISHAGGLFEALGNELLVKLVFEIIAGAECVSEGAHTGFILGPNLQHKRTGRSSCVHYACSHRVGVCGMDWCVRACAYASLSMHEHEQRPQKLPATAVAGQLQARTAPPTPSPHRRCISHFKTRPSVLPSLPPFLPP